MAKAALSATAVKASGDYLISFSPMGDIGGGDSSCARSSLQVPTVVLGV